MICIGIILWENDASWLHNNETQVTKIRNDKEAWVISCCVGERAMYRAGPASYGPFSRGKV